MKNKKDQKCIHIWDRYFCNMVARNNSTDLTTLQENDIKSFSVCKKCGNVCYCNIVGKVINCSM